MHCIFSNIFIYKQEPAYAAKPPKVISIFRRLPEEYLKKILELSHPQQILKE
jgi:hypothetical protein